MQDALLGCDLEDPGAQEECERGVKKVSGSRVCTLQGRAHLVDSQGKLTAAARPCVDAILAVYNRAAHACGKECSSLLRSASPPEETKPPEPALHPAVTPNKI